MNKKYFRPRFANLLPFVALCLFLLTSIQAQEIVEDFSIPYEKFKEAKKVPCGQRREAVRIGKEIAEKFGGDENNKLLVDWVKEQIPVMEQEEKECGKDNSLDELLENFQKAKNSSDGQCAEVIKLGKLLLQKLSNESKVAENIKNQVAAFGNCRDELFSKNLGYSSTQPSVNEILKRGKEIITAEGGSSLGLDAKLDFVAAGFFYAVNVKIDTYNSDTLYYAKSAIEQIESGQISKTEKWGIFMPYNQKESALGWMNYIVGWLLYNKMSQQKDALSYFYKGIRSGIGREKDPKYYSYFGNYYFDEAVHLDTQYRDICKTNNNKETEETKALLALAKGMADRAIDAFGRAYKFALANKEKKETIDNLYKTLNDLYAYRFNLDPKINPKGVDEYFEKLISRPMPDPTTPVEPVSEVPIEIKIQRNKSQ